MIRAVRGPVSDGRQTCACGVAALVAVLLAGCDSREQLGPDAPTKAEVGRIPFSPQRPGDPEQGRHALLNRSATTCGVPYDAYRRAAGASVADPGPQFTGREGRNAELPYGLTAFATSDRVELVTTNCLLCHAAPFEGELVMGLGNAFLDLTLDPLIAVAATGTEVRGAAEKRAWQRWAERVLAIADHTMTDTVGVNSAHNLAWVLMAHRDPKTLAWSDKPPMEPPPERPVPVAVPPLWNLKKKHALFYTGAGRGDHARFLTLASNLCTDSVQEAQAIDAWMTDVRAYLASLKAPAYPYGVERALADRGWQVFQARCRSCHGTYEDDGEDDGPDWRYPNRIVARSKVGTDPLLARTLYTDTDRFIDWFRRSFYGELSRAAPALGYVAPPLDGVWATAPYLHNDSVPTLDALLDSRSRPPHWRFARTAEDRPIYDRQRVGWRFESLPAGKSAAMSWDERNRIYDTGLPGYGNGGHTYGDRLSAEDRRALIEYLKTL